MLVPESVVIELTNNCNAECVYCAHHLMKRKKGFMSDEVFKKIIDDCLMLKIKSIEPQLEGEPTLIGDLVSKLKHIRKKLPWAKINLITNGSFLNKEIAEEVSHIDISFNYADRKSFGKGTGLDFNLIEYNILNLKQFKDKMSIHFVLSKTNWQDYFKVKKLFPEFNVSVNPLFNTNRGVTKDLNVFSYDKRIPCDKLKQFPILWNGDGAMCCNDYEGETAKYIGNIKEKSLLELYNCDYLNEMRAKDKALKYRGTFCEKCNGNMEVKFCYKDMEKLK